jgi:alpha-N-acetylglucosaminidase
LFPPTQLLIAALAAGLAAAQPPSPGTVQAAYDLLERVLPGSSAHFALSIAPTCAGVSAGRSCFTLSDAGAQTAIAGTSASELTAGIGHYFREFCNMTIGWPRGGGSNVFTPAAWPSVGAAPLVVARIVPYSYIMNVCTHSYSLVWYDWPAWEKFIDWMALSGVNFFLAMTGQEEVSSSWRATARSASSASCPASRV